MNRLIATAACAVGILILFRLDRKHTSRTSIALLIPMAWLLIAGSRNVSEWFQTSGSADAVDRYMEGNPVDRSVLSMLMLGGLIILAQRRQRVAALLKANLPIMAYFLYCGVSVLWSDYPLVGGKRWLRSLGDLIMVLVILTDSNWHTAVKRVLTGVAFLLLPISVLFIRFYPELGRAYGADGSLYWTGVATGKNSLGMICLIFGLACLWSFLEAYRAKGDRHRKRRLVAQAIVVTVALYLLWISDSKTSLSCFALVGALMTLTSFTLWVQRPVVLRVLIIAMVSCCFSVLFLGVSSGALETIGRNSTLTGRTDVWKLVLRFAENPLIGAGYESFWMGKRLEEITRINGGINQAHNGYIEIYLNLGWVGVSLLAILLVAGYRKVIFGFRRDPEVCRIMLAYFLVGIVYNFTEGAFKMMSPIWISFLLGTMAVPRLRLRKVPAVVPAATDHRLWADVPLRQSIAK
jgi:exopolysaccharide production protein ExoQ